MGFEAVEVEMPAIFAVVLIYAGILAAVAPGVAVVLVVEVAPDAAVPDVAAVPDAAVAAAAAAVAFAVIALRDVDEGLAV